MQPSNAADAGVTSLLLEALRMLPGGQGAGLDDEVKVASATCSRASPYSESNPG